MLRSTYISRTQEFQSCDQLFVCSVAECCLKQWCCSHWLVEAIYITANIQLLTAKACLCLRVWVLIPLGGWQHPECVCLWTCALLHHGHPPTTPLYASAAWMSSSVTSSLLSTVSVGCSCSVQPQLQWAGIIGPTLFVLYWVSWLRGNLRLCKEPLFPKGTTPRAPVLRNDIVALLWNSV